MPLPTPPKARGSRLNMKALGDLAPSTSIQHAQALEPIQAAGGSGRSRAENASSAQVVALKPLVPATYEEPSAGIDLPSVQHKASGKKTAAPRRNPKAKAAKTKLFVLDTNVLLHDPTCLFHFEEHDVFIPMIVLEELDGHKKGLTDLARNARQVSRWLDQLAAHPDADVVRGLDLSTCGHAAENQVMGRLFFQTEPIDHSLPAALPQGKADNQILGVFAALKAKHADREVVLVSKDINIRVKARALGLEAEDYTNDQTLDDAALLYAGWSVLAEDFWDEVGDHVESWQEKGVTFYRVRGDFVRDWRVNEFVTQSQPGKPEFNARIESITGNTAVLRTVRDYGSVKNALIGITARNREQNYALNLLMDENVDFVTLAGNAGTGKTLMVLASALSQVLDEKRYTEIIITRVTVPVADDIGFLPGNEEEKMAPWMGAVDDNLEVLASNRGTGGSGPDWSRSHNTELIRSKIKIKSMNFMRGRTFLNKFVIVDEAQNLTPKQMKTLITRAGPGTKIVCMGNLGQIDTPYLTEGSSGLTYAVERFKGWAHSGHITLAKGERSRLADFASEIL